MRERDRKSIEIDKMLPQFTTMNVIEGQAGLVNYSSLIFYSLTLNNILNIIVLLILAGVTIGTLMGDNGILTKAQQAKTETEEAEEDELRRLTALEAVANLENQPYTDVNGDTATIPAGFAVSKVEGEDSIEDGLVIIDKNGNEFVWIPVNKENFDTEFVRRSGYFDGEKQTLTDYGEADKKGNNSKVTESETTQKEANQMYESVKENGGFYIGRYEAGCEIERNKENQTIAQKVLIKKGVNVYNYVPWSRNKTMNEDSPTSNNIDGAVELSRNFDTINNYTTVTSTLCYGVQWDTTLTWIDSDYTGYANDSTGKGNYNEDENTNVWKGTVNLTGIGEKYKVNNIYDLAGNVNEWTMESYSTNTRVPRGGNYVDIGSKNPSSVRSSIPPASDFYAGLGFRITLYLN